MTPAEPLIERTRLWENYKTIKTHTAWLAWNRIPTEPSVSRVRVNSWAAGLEGFSICWMVSHVGLTLDETGERTDQICRESSGTGDQWLVLNLACTVLSKALFQWQSAGWLPQQSPDSEPTVFLPQQLQTIDPGVTANYTTPVYTAPLCACVQTRSEL